MKKTLLTLALVAVSAAAFAQGKITFGNDSLHYFVIGSALAGDAGGGVQSTVANTAGGATGAILAGPMPSGKTLQASLYAGTTASSITLRTTLPMTGAFWGPTAGRMVNQIITFGDIGFNTSANFQIVLTDVGATLPASLDNTIQTTSIANALYFGTSGAFTRSTGSSLTAPTLVSGTWAANNLVINAVPEPSSMALAGIGAASLLIFRRKK